MIILGFASLISGQYAPPFQANPSISPAQVYGPPKLAPSAHLYDLLLLLHPPRLCPPHGAKWIEPGTPEIVAPSNYIGFVSSGRIAVWIRPSNVNCGSPSQHLSSDQLSRFLICGFPTIHSISSSPVFAVWDPIFQKIEAGNWKALLRTPIDSA